MGKAYTPGLKVTANETVRKRRILPLKGEVMVEVGQRVKHDDVVAATFLPGVVTILNIANKLGIDQSDVKNAMVKGEGDEIEKGEVIAKAKSFFGLFKSEATASATGTIESISNVTGQVVVRGPDRPVQVKAYVNGEITEVIPDEGVVVETTGSFIQGIFGVGGETTGSLTLAVTSPGEKLVPDLIHEKHRDRIIIGGSLVTYGAIKKAVEMGVRGIVSGGLDDADLRQLLGYDLGVAITGHEDLGITVVVTEGFGQIDMAPRTFKLLKDHEGDQVSINGATQIRAGVIRPEVIIPVEGATHVEDEQGELGVLQIGSLIRVIRAPHFGMLGNVTDIPHEPAVLESGSRARVAEVELEGGERILLPRANLERIEE